MQGFECGFSNIRTFDERSALVRKFGSLIGLLPTENTLRAFGDGSRKFQNLPNRPLPCGGE